MHFDPFCFWLFWCLISRYFKAVGCFWQSKNTISFIYTIPNCTEEQQYIILLWSTILWNFRFHWQLSILVEKFHFCSSDSSLKISEGAWAPPAPPPATGLLLPFVSPETTLRISLFSHVLLLLHLPPCMAAIIIKAEKARKFILCWNCGRKFACKVNDWWLDRALAWRRSGIKGKD